MFKFEHNILWLINYNQYISSNLLYEEIDIWIRLKIYEKIYVIGVFVSCYLWMDL